MESLRGILKRYKENMDRQRELDESLLVDQSKEAWIACLEKRAVENQQMYIENDQLIQQIEEILKNDLTEADAELLYQEAKDMYVNNYDDCQILLPMFHKLEEYYVDKTSSSENLGKLLYIYGALYYETNEIQKRREGVDDIDISYNLKILSYRERYTELSPLARRCGWIATYNIIVSGMCLEDFGIDKSYKYYKEAMAFWNRPEVQELDKDNIEITPIVERIKKEWLTVEYYIEQGSQETKEGFCKLAEEIFNEELEIHKDIYSMDCGVYAAYLHASVLTGKCTMDSVVDTYLSYYNEKMKQILPGKEITIEDFSFITHAPLILERWLQYGLSKEKQLAVIEILKNMTRDSWYRRLGKYASPFLNALMVQWCFEIIKYLEYQDEKEELIFQLLIQRQLPTYMHSVLVAHLAEALTKVVRRDRPELFEGLDVRKEDLLGFVRQCALLHDIGKTKITDIVNTQGRRLWDIEFRGIKKHPEYGAEMLEQDEDLKKYRDISLGHHKFYDGSGGYPESFDNVNSPYRIIIDIITICDCIDAATDHLGRNYKKAKILEEVIQEFKAGKGTQYNPDLVEIIDSNPLLQKEMSYIVNEGRLNTMYRAYLHQNI